VRESVSITADEAARLKVVDFVAKDIAELVTRADGRKVDVAGVTRRLELDGVRAADGEVRTETYTMRLSQRVLDVIAHPTVAYLLLTAGLLGLYIEFTHPGVAFPGVFGAICLLLGLTALQVLDVNVSALALLLLGVGLLIAEAFLPTFGVLGAGGLVAFLLGSLFLFDAETGLEVPRSIVFGVGGTVGGIFLVIATLVLRAQRAPAALGAEGMVGEIGIAHGRLAPAGTVLVHGEYWSAESEDAVNDGDRVEVTAVNGLRLRVRRVRRASGA
jgi:membrane-bound serine protease (ClpP class)